MGGLQPGEQLRNNRPARDTHDHDGRAGLGVPPQPLDTERKNGRPHHRIGEAQGGDETDADITLRQKGAHCQNNAKNCRPGQIALLADEARNGYQPGNIAHQHGDQREGGEEFCLVQRQAKAVTVGAYGVTGHDFDTHVKEKAENTKP